MSGDADAVRFFQALGDGTRLALLTELRRDERTVGELVDTLGCPQPKVSRHLKVLKEAGLVRDRREGRNVTYALTTVRSWPRPAREWLARLEAGLVPPEMVAERPAPRRKAPPRRSRESPEPPPPPSPRPRRRDLETHLL